MASSAVAWSVVVAWACRLLRFGAAFRAAGAAAWPCSPPLAPLVACGGFCLFFSRAEVRITLVVEPVSRRHLQRAARCPRCAVRLSLSRTERDASTVQGASLGGPIVLYPGSTHAANHLYFEYFVSAPCVRIHVP